MTLRSTLCGTAASAAVILGSTGLAGAVELSVLVLSGPDDVAKTEALTAAYTAKNPDVTFEIELRAGGSEGDNIVRTRLATGVMADIFQYNSGSLFRALRPTRTMTDLSDLPSMAGVMDDFKTAVTADGGIYGVPYEGAMGGGVFYNKKVYEQLGLAVPQTWDAFMANNAKVKEAGIVPIGQTYRDTWTSQLFVLSDFYNVLAEAPTFAEDFTANKAKFATTPAALRGFEHLAETFEAGYFNEDFGAASYDDGIRMIATGEVAHYPMLTFAISAIQQNHPELLNDVGFFALPGPHAASNGLTVWTPGALYIPADSANEDEAKDFLNFVASREGCEVMNQAVGAIGPYMIEGCELPEDVAASVKDMLPYFEEGRTAPALEYLSPVKGPALEQIAVEVGSGIRPAADGAALYDQDVEKQARQLGLEGW